MNSDKMDLENLDYEILSLFPSLDFNRAGINPQSKQGMKRNLSILYLAAKKGKVTKYLLTDERSEIRMGGQSAQLGLEKLVEIGLLKNYETVNEKGTIRIDRKLTPKGLIACLIFKKFQNKLDFEKVLKKIEHTKSKLIAIISLYNDPSLRRLKIADPVSPITYLIKYMGKRKYNIELKSENEIAQDIPIISDNIFLESLQGDQIDMVNNFMIGLSKQDEQTRKSILDLLSKNSEVYTEFFSTMDPQSQTEATKQYLITSKKMMNSLILFVTSPELLNWLKKTDNITEIQKLKDEALKEVEKSKIKDPIEKFILSFETMRNVLREKM